MVMNIKLIDNIEMGFKSYMAKSYMNNDAIIINNFSSFVITRMRKPITMFYINLIA